MKKLIYSIIIMPTIHGILFFLWLYTANSINFLLLKDLIPWIDIVAFAIILLGLKKLKEVLVYCLCTGFLGGILSYLIIQYLFPSAIHEQASLTGMASALCLSFLLTLIYSILGFVFYGLKSLFLRFGKP